MAGTLAASFFLKSTINKITIRMNIIDFFIPPKEVTFKEAYWPETPKGTRIVCKYSPMMGLVQLWDGYGNGAANVVPLTQICQTPVHHRKTYLVEVVWGKEVKIVREMTTVECIEYLLGNVKPSQL